MGTNFYIFTRNKAAKELLGRKVVLTDEPDFGYELHIAKTSAGWLPLFEAHENVHSVADLRRLFDQIPDAQIVDEYGEAYSWPQFEERVVRFGNDFNWRSSRNNDFSPGEIYRDPYEYISSDGYRFSSTEFC